MPVYPGAQQTQWTEVGVGCQESRPHGFEKSKPFGGAGETATDEHRFTQIKKDPEAGSHKQTQLAREAIDNIASAAFCSSRWIRFRGVVGGEWGTLSMAVPAVRPGGPAKKQYEPNWRAWSAGECMDSENRSHLARKRAKRRENKTKPKT